MRKMKLLGILLLSLCFAAGSLVARYHWEGHDSEMKHAKGDSSAMHDHGKKREKPMGATVVAHVEGMVCDFCARGLEKGFNKKREVSNTIVSLEQGTVTLQMRGDQMLSDEEINEIIEDNGMSVDSIDHGNTSIREETKKSGGMKPENRRLKQKEDAEVKEEERSGLGWW